MKSVVFGFVIVEMKSVAYDPFSSLIQKTSHKLGQCKNILLLRRIIFFFIQSLLVLISLPD